MVKIFRMDKLSMNSNQSKRPSVGSKAMLSDMKL
jgi:hypothetical protein